MNRIERLRRAAILCCHFVRNYAYYQGGWIDVISLANNEFWITVQNDFLDISILEWMKLFGSYKDKHHWTKVIHDSEAFKINMLDYCHIGDDEFNKDRENIKKYRDKFVGHLDSEKVMNIPRLHNALNAVKYYYKCVYVELPFDSRFHLPSDLEEYYDNCLFDSKSVFQSIKACR